MKNDQGQICKRIEAIAVLDHQSKNYHAFSIRETDGVKGSIYVRKDASCPNTVVVHLKTKGEIAIEEQGKE